MDPPCACLSSDLWPSFLMVPFFPHNPNEVTGLRGCIEIRTFDLFVVFSIVTSGTDCCSFQVRDRCSVALGNQSALISAKRNFNDRTSDRCSLLCCFVTVVVLAGTTCTSRTWIPHPKEALQTQKKKTFKSKLAPCLHLHFSRRMLLGSH